jgi:hypothetical protein
LAVVGRERGGGGGKQIAAAAKNARRGGLYTFMMTGRIMGLRLVLP